MDALDLLTNAYAAGLTVHVDDGDRLLVRGPRSAASVVEQIRQHKADMLAVLKAQISCMQEPLATAPGEPPEQALDAPDETLDQAEAERPWWLDVLPAFWPDYCPRAPTRHHIFARLRMADGRRVCIECNQPEEARHRAPA